MAAEQSENRRWRAWVLIQARPEVAEELYKALGHEGEHDYVVVRADVVETTEYGFNIVVPVDAASKAWLGEVFSMIKGFPGVENAVEVPVAQHNPRTPNRAHGYISVEEAAEYPPEEGGFPSGRLSRSPGANAWG